MTTCRSEGLCISDAPLFDVSGEWSALAGHILHPKNLATHLNLAVYIGGWGGQGLLSSIIR